MAIFSFKSKAKQAEERKKEEDAAVPIESKKPAKKYIPKHARTESSQAIENIRITNQMQKQDSSFYSIPAEASYTHGMPHNMTHGSSTPSLLNRRHTSNDAFTTSSSDYFSPAALRKLQANDPALGYAKVAIARHDQGWGHGSSDSGYESAGPSRVPSVQKLDEMPRQYLPQPTQLPELRFADDSRSERSLKSAAKKTRFQDETESTPLSVEPVLPAESGASAEAVLPAKPVHSVEVVLPVKTTQPVEAVLPARTVSSPEQQLSQSMNLAALEGYKVNKKGKVLNEEGDLIGELVEGDLLDCVRQKVNARGQVMDDIGKVVGTVKIAPTLLPSLHVLPPSAQPSPSADDDSSPTGAPRSPNLDGLSAQDAVRRSARSASERCLSELSKTYVRPPMSSVPENNVPGEEEIPTSPELFAYKGEIPAAPPQHVRRRSFSPPSLNYPTSARHPNHRRISSGAMSTRSLGKQPLSHISRRPYSSYENSPNGSDDGTETSNSDDGKLPSIAYARPGSVRSAVTVPAKPRTYFSHAGRVTVDPNAPAAVPKEAPPKMKVVDEQSAEVAGKEEKNNKKKSRLGLRFGKK